MPFSMKYGLPGSGGICEDRRYRVVNSNVMIRPVRHAESGSYDDLCQAT